MQHQRGLDHRGMLQRETGKAFREDVGQGLLVAEIPVLQAHHLQPGVRPEVAQRQLDALGDEPLVLVMAEHQHQAAHTVAMELTHGVAHQGAQGRAIQAGGTAEVLAAAAFRLRLVAV